MRIDIISDVVCPWCYVGKRRIERALKDRPDMAFEITWRPYQLNPDLPPDGMDRKAYLKQKFGEEQYPASMLTPLQKAGQEEGIPFNFEGIAKAPNTLAAHSIIRWAQTAGLQDAVVQRLFDAYFLEGRDIGDHGTLVELAGDAGMDEDLVRTLLAENRDHDLIRAEISQALQMGVRGVPSIIFDGKYALSGAQPPETILRVIDKAQPKRL